MKFVMVQFADATDISSLVVDSTVQVGTVPGGTVIMAGTMQNPPAPVDISKLSTNKHAHSLDAPGANTGPAIEPAP